MLPPFRDRQRIVDSSSTDSRSLPLPNGSLISRGELALRESCKHAPCCEQIERIVQIRSAQYSSLPYLVAAIKRQILLVNIFLKSCDKRDHFLAARASTPPSTTMVHQELPSLCRPASVVVLHDDRLHRQRYHGQHMSVHRAGAAHPKLSYTIER